MTSPTPAAPLSQERVREIEQMLSAVTPGPWIYADGTEAFDYTHAVLVRVLDDDNAPTDRVRVMVSPNPNFRLAKELRFIAASPTIVRDLLSDRDARESLCAVISNHFATLDAKQVEEALASELAAANERNAQIAALSARVAELEAERDAAIADTREQAAKVCENRAETLPPIESNEARKCARAIRAKGFAGRFRPVRCDCASCLASRMHTYAQTCCPNGLSHGAVCACGGGTIKSLREFDAKYFPDVHARAEANDEYDAEGHKR